VQTGFITTGTYAYGISLDVVLTTSYLEFLELRTLDIETDFWDWQLFSVDVTKVRSVIVGILSLGPMRKQRTSTAVW
jgi:hypothetical protein